MLKRSSLKPSVFLMKLRKIHSAYIKSSSSKSRQAGLLSITLTFVLATFFFVSLFVEAIKVFLV